MNEKKYNLHTFDIPLQEDEYLLKIHDGVGFMTKLTQKGQYPKAFENWKNYIYFNKKNEIVLPVFVIKEEFREGWKIEDYRPGKSQGWAVMVHPDGFEIEIYLTNFFHILLSSKLENGTLIGEFKWKDHKLIKNI
jgi:hypothetical protein